MENPKPIENTALFFAVRKSVEIRHLVFGFVLENYDNVEIALDQNGNPKYSTEFMSGNNKPSPLLKYSKRVDGTYYVIEAVPNSKTKTVFVVSAYMSKKAGGRQAAPAEAKRITSETQMPNLLLTPV